MKITLSAAETAALIQSQFTSLFSGFAAIPSISLSHNGSNEDFLTITADLSIMPSRERTTFISVDEDEDPAESEPTTEAVEMPQVESEDKPKRTRRTKAQIEADRLAELAAANAAVEDAEAVTEATEQLSEVAGISSGEERIDPDQEAEGLADEQSDEQVEEELEYVPPTRTNVSSLLDEAIEGTDDEPDAVEAPRSSSLQGIQAKARQAAVEAESEESQEPEEEVAPKPKNSLFDRIRKSQIES